MVTALAGARGAAPNGKLLFMEVSGMCQTNAYVVDETGLEALYMEAVDIVRPEGEGRLYLRNLFGEERVYEGGIREMRLAKNRIVLGR